jgi:hypothetical protein
MYDDAVQEPHMCRAQVKQLSKWSVVSIYVRGEIMVFRSSDWLFDRRLGRAVSGNLLEEEDIV